MYGLKPAFRRALGPALRLACRFHPNTVSIAAVLFAALAGGALVLAKPWPWLLLVVPAPVFLRIACNALDGMVAQVRGLSSPRGELVNEFSDRLSDALIFGGLALSGLVNAALALGVLAASLGISYLGILPKAAGGPRLYSGPFGKADRMLLLAVACILAYALPMWMTWTASDILGASLWLGLALALVTLTVRWTQAWKSLGGAA